ncbi:hypothetical protein HJG60_010039 [Phyllostomus discolor]|uniref:Uncharacterized protein n=1 Tax=Phyllostomus discolor TaxID=89673 RepID=A0A834AS57_9CHIR|nr:hypothetical protein HJG60_010039 [Phyllostomus discolor]
MRLWQVGHAASGSPPPESTKAFGTPPSPATPSEQLLWQWVPPRQTLPASPCTGHQLYLPQRGSALAPQPSAICSPDFSGASPVWAALPPSPLAPTQVTGSGRPLLSGKGWTPPYAPSQLPPPTLAHTGTPTPGQLVISPRAGRGGDLPLSVLKHEEKRVSRSVAPALGPGPSPVCLVSNLGILLRFYFF